MSLYSGRSRADQRDASRFRPLALAIVCAAVGLVITTLMTTTTMQREREDAAAETDSQLIAIGDAIDRQVSRYAETLFGLRAAFARDPDLSRRDFRSLVDIDALTRRAPGAESVTFNRQVADVDLAAFESAVRREVPSFIVHPSNPGAEHVVVDYVEPQAPASRALGLDIASEPVRRAALEFARESGELSATRPLTLVQDPSGPGFLLMLAAYDQSPVPVTAPARTRHFLGVLVAVFAADTMIEQAAETRPDLAIAIYDAGPTVDVPRPRPATDDWVLGKVERYTNFADIDVGTRRWRLVTDSPVSASAAPAIAVATSGAALTVLVAGALAAVSSSRRRALKLADQMTIELRTSDEQLRAANEALRGFIDVAAHDLKSPLVSIAGFSAILNDDQMDLTEEERLKAVQTIDRQSTHMGRLIDDLLTMSSIDGGGLSVRPDTIVLSEAIRECLESTNGHARLVSVSCPPDLVVRVDADHLRRILENYVHNAVKYGEPPLRIIAHQTGETVEIRVMDQGPGVSPEFASRLFTKFSRADTAATRTQKGTGLGLSIVRGLARANGGDALYVPNTPRGACFIVHLPAANPAS